MVSSTCSSSSASHDDFDDEKLCVLLEGGKFSPAPMLGTALVSCQCPTVDSHETVLYGYKKR